MYLNIETHKKIILEQYGKRFGLLATKESIAQLNL